MSSVHIRNLAPETLAGLKRLARTHRRSLQGELHTILERAARMAPAAEGDGLHLVTVRVGDSRSWRREEIYGPDGR